MRVIGALTRLSTRLVERILPDPFVLVLLLTLFIFSAGVLFEGRTPGQMVDAWGTGFWQLLEFSMQMVLVLVSGFVLASSPVVKRLLQSMAGRIESPRSAIVIVTLVSLTASWINWGFGLIVGTLFAKAVATRLPGRVPYALLVASGYSGFLVWHGGLSGSVPLSIATPGHLHESLIGVIPVSETMFAGFNLLLLLALFLLLPILNAAMMSGAKNPEGMKPLQIDDDRAPEDAPSIQASSFSEKLEHSRWITVLIFILGGAYLIRLFLERGFALNLNLVNFIFLLLGLLFHQTPRRFLKSLESAIRGSAGIVIQFPFYAGIMGMMTASGLAQSLSEFFVALASAETLPFFSFLSAGILNLVIPSGGGQWAIQSQVMLPAALELKADLAKTSMAIAWGDAWTNMIQPFWALPALALAGLRAKDIMGYCLLVLFVSGLVISLAFLI